MKRALISIVLLYAFCGISFGHTHRSVKHTFDPSYCSALATANLFLHAWQSEDHETGIVMLSDFARQRTSPEQLQEFFSPGPDAAYEIARGKRIKSGSYIFPVVLFSNTAHSHRLTTKIVVMRDGKSEWSVANLP